MSTNNDDSTFTFNLKDLFSKTTMYYIILLIILYIIIYFALYIFFSSWFDTPEHMTVMTIDIFIIAITILYLIYFFNQMTPEDKKRPFTFICRQIKKELNLPISLVYMSIYLFVIYMSIFFFNIPKINGKLPASIHVLELKSWYFFIVLVVINILKFGFDIHIVDIIYDWIADTFNSLFKNWNIEKEDAIKETPESIKKIPGLIEPSPIIKEQVFNISDNKYTYEDAQSICKVYNSRLATYSEMEDAYKNGAEWCNYGWSENQQALFPTQKSTWNELQKNSKSKNNCGRPGINGGYISNANIKYGVNCFGIKPAITDKDIKYSKIQSQDKIEDIIEETNVWKNKHSELIVSSYNNDKWSNTNH